MRAIEERQLTGRVVPVGVFDDTDALLAAADVFVAPDPDGAPLAVLEAMAAAAPLVAADVPANGWLVTEGLHGRLVPPGDAAALAAAVSGLFERPEWAARLGAAAWRRAAAEFPLARMVDEHLRLLDQIQGDHS
jgi:glycosyltransferase involved in cell wall biosynthesis